MEAAAEEEARMLMLEGWSDEEGWCGCEFCG